ncbi:UvrB/UvrC motif-containing protein [Thalassobacillus hwangdonensis]|uniref:UvrB/UvrC motif-containing protein n=1 Tax=Thalassobacillus hwangdonensis TaxID=546108 RepID=A0ABW3L995_9BACI
MECQECHQRPATVHLKQVTNGKKTEFHVCEQCAKEKGYMSYSEESFTLNDLLTGLFNYDHPSSLGSHQAQTKKEQQNQMKCPKCGLTYEQFAHIGKFGCAKCYDTFNERLNPIFKRVHSGNTMHDGKIPERAGGKLHLQKQIEQQKQQLHQLIEQEEFEKAATVRDEIRALERQLNGDGGGDA